MHAELISHSWLYRSLDVFTPSGAFRVEYDAVGLRSGQWSYDSILVNGVIAVKTKSLLWFVPRCAFHLGSLAAVLEVRVWPWLTLRTFRLSVGGEIVYDEATRPREAPPRPHGSTRMTVCGIALVLTGLLAVSIGKQMIIKNHEVIYGGVSAIVGAFLILVGVGLFNHGRRERAVTAQEAISIRTPMPIQVGRHC